MEKLTRFIETLGVDIYGYADISMFEADLRSNLDRGIAIGIAVDSDIIRKIPDGPHMDYVEAYISINAKLDEISDKIASYIEEMGYLAVSQTRAYVSNQIEMSKNDSDNIYGKALMPHKTVAASAGLGFITKSALLITERYGSAVRFGSILTNAPIPVYAFDYSCRCGDCTVCADNCPTGAIYGKTWTRETPREELINYELCQKSFMDRGKLIDVTSGGGTCGVCIAVCPYTKKYLNT